MTSDGKAGETTEDLTTEIAQLRLVVYLYVDPHAVRPEHEAVVARAARLASIANESDISPKSR